MRRRVLHVSAGLLTFTAGFLTAGRVEHLWEALPLALCVFVLTSALPEFGFSPRREFDFHWLKVAAITFVLWIPVLAFYLPLLMPPGLGNCTPDAP
jgi:hypothetical protein